MPSGAYNGLGARTFRRSADGHDHAMAIDGITPGGALLYDTDGAGTIFTPGLGQTSAGQSRYALDDALGSLRVLQDASWAMTDDLRYEAFGGPVYHGGSAPSNLPLGWAGAAGYQSDWDTGLMLLGNRYYDASIGRFITPDPAQDGTNWYAYCGNNPLGGVDPEGLDTLSIDVTTTTTTTSWLEYGGKVVPGSLTTTSTSSTETYNFQIPDGFNVANNVSEAQTYAAGHWISAGGSGRGRLFSKPDLPSKELWLAQKVWPGTGVWDIKKGLSLKDPRRKPFDIVGNYAYGAEAHGLGLTLGQTLKWAGAAQTFQSVRGGFDDFVYNYINHGNVLTGPPYGDDARAQHWMTLGWQSVGQ